ncbi:MAG: hypothetical protein IJ574_00975 [Bacilli bacterium]|nr:hypothetical protein [Bacilli bacterium]
MKTLYQRMSKEEKKQLKEEYKKTEVGKEVLKKFKISLIMFILTYIFSIYLIIDTYLNKRSNAYYLYAGAIIVCVIVCLVNYRKNYQRILNDYAINKNKNKNK